MESPRPTIPSMLLLAALLGASSCAGDGNSYDPSALHGTALGKKTGWSENLSPELKPPSETNLAWWRRFNDPLLVRLVAEALRGSPEVRIAELRVADAELQLKETRSAWVPRTNFTGNASHFRRHTENNNRFLEPIEGEDDLGETIEEAVTSADDSTYYNLGLNVNWELDIWGKNRVRRMTRRAAYEESRANRRAAKLRLAAEVARTYVDLRKLDEEATVLSRLHDVGRRRLLIYGNQHREGLLPQWRLAREKGSLDDLEKQMIELVIQRRKLENRLAVLTGRPPGDFTVPDTSGRPPMTPVAIPPGLPSDLLSRRPDLIAAQYRVEQAYHRIGEARKARLPTISLTGQAGLASISLSDLLRQWTLGVTPVLGIPLMDGGAMRKRVKSSEIQARIAALEYGKTVHQAFEEVENLLQSLSAKMAQRRIWAEKHKTLLTIREQTREKYEMGLISQLDLLEIERERLSLERTAVEIHRFLLEQNIQLCKALGGGWPADPEKAAAQAQMIESKTSRGKRW